MKLKLFFLLSVMFLAACSGSSQEEAGIFSVASSSTLRNPHDRYSIRNIVDGDIGSCWVEGASGYGIGQSFTVTFDRKITLKFFYIFNGYNKAGLYSKNGRVKTLDVNGVKVHIPDTGLYKSRKAVLPESVSGKRFVFTIRDVYRGSRWKDTCISEIIFSRKRFEQIDFRAKNKLKRYKQEQELRRKPGWFLGRWFYKYNHNHYFRLVLEKDGGKIKARLTDFESGEHTDAGGETAEGTAREIPGFKIRIRWKKSPLKTARFRRLAYSFEEKKLGSFGRDMD